MIGQLLVANRAITQDQLDLALQEQRRSGALLGDVLVSMKFVAEDSLAKALAQEARVPFVSLEGAIPDSRASSLVHEMLALLHSRVPVSRTATRVKVAHAHPFDVTSIDDLRADRRRWRCARPKARSCA